MVYVGNKNFKLFYNKARGPVHRGEAMDYKERFMIANYYLDGFDDAAIARLVKRSNNGVKKYWNALLRRVSCARRHSTTPAGRRSCSFPSCSISKFAVTKSRLQCN